MMAQMPADPPDPDRGPGHAAHQRHRVLVVCTGNICRSPMAEVALRSLAASRTLPDGRTLAGAVTFDSAGTSRWHEGSEMDPRARRALDDAGLVGEGSLARQVTVEDLASADLVVALDRGHREDLRRLDPGCTPVLLRSFVEDEDLDVADPYYGDEVEFAECLAQIVTSCEALLDVLATAVGSAT